MRLSSLHFLVQVVSGWLCRRQRSALEYVMEENRVLREQLGKRRLRFTDGQRKRLAKKGKALGRRALREVATLVTADTILRWYRRLVAAKYDSSGKRGPGRPRVNSKIRALVIRLAKDNPRWGYTRIVGALSNVGHEVHRNTVQRVLAEEGILPAPERGKRIPWSQFLRTHWAAIAAADFFVVEVLTWRGLERCWVLFVIELRTRRVQIGGVTRCPSGEWMLQMGRNALDCFDGLLSDKRFLIVDRDPLFTAEFRKMLRDAGVGLVRLPARSPNLNAYAERFVRSVRQECLRFVIPLGEAHLRRVVSEYVEHYHLERNHQGLDNRLIDGGLRPANDNGDVVRRKRLGGLLNYYFRGAA